MTSKQEAESKIESTIQWLKDRKGSNYRCKIGGLEYIRTFRKERKPAKPRVLSEHDKVKRRTYMKNYRRDERAKMVALKRLVCTLQNEKE